MDHFWEQVEGGFWYPLAYRRLFEALPQDDPSRWVEVGVFQGQSLSWLGVETINSGKPITIHAVDNFAGWPGVPMGQDLRDRFDRNTAPLRAALGDRFHVHAKPSVEAAADFFDQSCDVIWIDADHSEAAVLADIDAWWPKLKPGGYLGGDDYLWPGVATAVHARFTHHVSLIPGWRTDESYTGPWPSWIIKK